MDVDNHSPEGRKMTGIDDELSTASATKIQNPVCTKNRAQCSESDQWLMGLIIAVAIYPLVLIECIRLYEIYCSVKKLPLKNGNLHNALPLQEQRIPRIPEDRVKHRVNEERKDAIHNSSLSTEKNHQNDLSLQQKETQTLCSDGDQASDNTTSSESFGEGLTEGSLLHKAQVPKENNSEAEPATQTPLQSEEQDPKVCAVPELFGSKKKKRRLSSTSSNMLGLEHESPDVGRSHFPSADSLSEEMSDDKKEESGSPSESDKLGDFDEHLDEEPEATNGKKPANLHKRTLHAIETCLLDGSAMYETLDDDFLVAFAGELHRHTANRMRRRVKGTWGFDYGQEQNPEHEELYNKIYQQEEFLGVAPELQKVLIDTVRAGNDIELKRSTVQWIKNAAGMHRLARIHSADPEDLLSPSTDPPDEMVPGAKMSPETEISRRSSRVRNIASKKKHESVELEHFQILVDTSKTLRKRSWRKEKRKTAASKEVAAIPGTSEKSYNSSSPKQPKSKDQKSDPALTALLTDINVSDRRRTNSAGQTIYICVHPGCEKRARTKGLCMRHGGKPRICEIEGCQSFVQRAGNGFCSAHFHQWGSQKRSPSMLSTEQVTPHQIADKSKNETKESESTKIEPGSKRQKTTSDLTVGYKKVVFQHQLLGLTIHGEKAAVVVKKVLNPELEGKVKAGDKILFVGNKYVGNKKQDQIAKIVKEANRPTTITFSSGRYNGDAEKLS